jgi:hypothetical protein
MMTPVAKGATGDPGRGAAALAAAPFDEDFDVRVVLVVLDEPLERVLSELSRHDAVDHGIPPARSAVTVANGKGRHQRRGKGRDRLRQLVAALKGGNLPRVSAGAAMA